MSWTIELHGRLPASMNERERSSHWTRHRELQDITNEILLLARASKIPTATGKRWVRITIHKGLRSRVTDDPANRDSRAKSILDAMVKAGLLNDDSDKWLEWRHVHEGERLPIKKTVIELGDAA